MSESYPDTNGNGVPDVFENRAPISVILNRDPSSVVKSAESIDHALGDRKYRLFVGPVFASNAVLLEVETRSASPRYGACIFTTEDDLREFIRQLENARVEAFGG